MPDKDDRTPSKHPEWSFWGLTIPQLSYDLLVRFIPGLFVLVSLQLFAPAIRPLSRLGEVGRDLPFPDFLSMVCLVTAAYLIGWLFGCFHHKDRERISFRELSALKTTLTSDDEDKADVKRLILQYFAVRELNPAAGLRLVKLRSESNMLSALTWGSWTVAFMVVMDACVLPKSPQSGCEVGLVATFFVCSGVAFQHLKGRMNRQYSESTRCQFWIQMALDPKRLADFAETTGKTDGP